jgi:hypothetical protein
MEKVVVEGDVYEREIDYGNSNEFFSTVEGLSDKLDQYIGKRVKITIELVD